MSGPHPDPLSDMLSKPHELDGRFEREAKTVTTCISDAALTSIAVSLKRIADAMDGGDASQGIQNSLFFLEQKMHGQYNYYRSIRLDEHHSFDVAMRDLLPPC